MAYDANLTLQATVTKTATFNGTGLDLSAGAANTRNFRPLEARVRYSAASNAAATSTATFSIDSSTDNTTFTALASGAKNAVVLVTTAKSGTINIPFVSPDRYVRLTMTISGTSTSPTIVYASEIGNALP